MTLNSNCCNDIDGSHFCIFRIQAMIITCCYFVRTPNGLTFSNLVVLFKWLESDVSGMIQCLLAPPSRRLHFFWFHPWLLPNVHMSMWLLCCNKSLILPRWFMPWVWCKLRWNILLIQSHLIQQITPMRHIKHLVKLIFWA